MSSNTWWLCSLRGTASHSVYLPTCKATCVLSHQGQHEHHRSEGSLLCLWKDDSGGSWLHTDVWCRGNLICCTYMNIRGTKISTFNTTPLHLKCAPSLLSAWWTLILLLLSSKILFWGRQGSGFTGVVFSKGRTSQALAVVLRCDITAAHTSKNKEENHVWEGLVFLECPDHQCRCHYTGWCCRSSELCEDPGAGGSRFVACLQSSAVGIRQKAAQSVPQFS